jgi:hypothetical protein
MHPIAYHLGATKIKYLKHLLSECPPESQLHIVCRSCLAPYNLRTPAPTCYDAITP